MPSWEPPRCMHGAILLGCLREDCAEQNEFINTMDAAVDRWYQRQQQEARKLVYEILGWEE